MNHDTPDTHDLSDTLRWQLRALRQDETPRRELWSGIAPRLAALPREGTGQPVAVKPSTSPAGRRWQLPVALAASVLVAVGTLGLLRYGGPTTGHVATGAIADVRTPPAGQRSTAGATNDARLAPVSAAHLPVALAEAEAMRLHYEGAFRELQTRPGDVAASPTLRTLDQSAELILAALRQAPDSTRLLEQLRRTYQRRLDLMRLPLA